MAMIEKLVRFRRERQNNTMVLNGSINGGELIVSL